MATETYHQLGVLGLFTETPLHCGAEGGTGYVDLPIQRERHTSYPVIPGSTLKGILKDELKAQLGGDGTTAIFGSLQEKDVEAENGGVKKERSTVPGTASFGDGLLVAFPVRSSAAPFHWVTCPFVLERAFRALQATVALDPPERGTAWAAESGEILLEEIRIAAKPHPTFFSEQAASGLSLLLRLLPEEGFEYTRAIFRQRLLIVTDADFKELVETGTEILTRIKLTALGTTTNLKEDEHPEIEGEDRKGNLFVEEVVPSQTLFLSPLRAGGARRSELRAALEKCRYARIGGDETIGRGLTHLTFLPGAQPCPK